MMSGLLRSPWMHPSPAKWDRSITRITGEWGSHRDGPTVNGHSRSTPHQGETPRLRCTRSILASWAWAEAVRWTRTTISPR
jgi:hypothetical protein